MKQAQTLVEHAAEALDRAGHAVLPGLLPGATCAALARLFDDDDRFRSSVDLARYRFGEGRYRYFAAPLPCAVETLRRTFYPPLARIAQRWAQRLGTGQHFAGDLAGYLSQCHAAGQTRPTPLLLRYETGGFNCLHQDRYGEVMFPLQMTVLLSRPGTDFEGGEFLLVEQRPRMQSRAEVVPLTQGDAVIFPSAVRPVEGSRGDYRVNVRHGVSRVHAGLRMTLGVIFHDAA